MVLLLDFKNIQARRYWIAYSGGMDSHVLLDLAASAWKNKQIAELIPVHVHHGLSANADRWVTHVQQVCGNYGLSCHICYVDAQKQPGESPEATARQARYDALSSLLQKNDVLLTAHHQRDQAETVLLQLFRGAGVDGLAAMPISKTLGLGRLVRPLLSYSHQALVEYATEHQLQWIEDESNASLRFKRNYVRLQLLPELEKQFPGVTTCLTRSASHCADAAEWIQTDLLEHFKQGYNVVDHSLNLDSLKTISSARQLALIRYWLKNLQLPIPHETHLEQIQKQLLNKRIDSHAQVDFAKMSLRVYQQRLYALQYPLCEFNIQGLIEGNMLQINTENITQPLQVRYRSSVLCGKTLKKRFQEAHIPPWDRDRIPLIYHADELIAIFNYWIAPKWRQKETT